MHNPFKVTDIVKDILTSDPSARNSDDYLYHEVCKRVNPAILQTPFNVVLFSFKSFGVPAYESVGRARRLIQAQNPELRPTEKVQDFRYENELKYQDYSKTIVR